MDLAVEAPVSYRRCFVTEGVNIACGDGISPAVAAPRDSGDGHCHSGDGQSYTCYIPLHRNETGISTVPSPRPQTVCIFPLPDESHLHTVWTGTASCGQFTVVLFLGAKYVCCILGPP